MNREWWIVEERITPRVCCKTCGQLKPQRKRWEPLATFAKHKDALSYARDVSGEAYDAGGYREINVTRHITAQRRLREELA